MNDQTPIFDPFRHTSGPKNAKILIIGDAWGKEELSASRPFTGSAGKELDRMLADAGLSRNDTLCTNVVNAYPAGGAFTSFLNHIKDAKPNYNGISASAEFLSGVTNLERLIDALKPSLIISAGNWPLFVLGTVAEVKTSAGFKLPTGASKWRGSQLYTRPINGKTYPLLPIIHPSTVIKEWGYRTVTVHDLRSRAQRFINGTLFWEAPAHDFIHKPTWANVQTFFTRLHSKLASGPTQLSVDLETYRRRWISVIGLADAETALAIPLFYVDRSKGQESTISYWHLWQETEIFRQCKLILEHPNVRIIGQNFIYDTQWFHRAYGINAPVTFDTMVAHHLAFPGTPKSLDYLASLYCNHYVYWKDESGDWDNFPEDAERYWLYSCKDTRATFEAAQTLETVLNSQNLTTIYYQDRIPQWHLARSMMFKGVACDSSLQREMKSQLLDAANALQEWLLNAVPETWRFTSTGTPWYDSPKGTATVLYQMLGLPVQLHKKTRQPTTDAEALAALRSLPSTAWLTPLLQRLEDLRSIGVFQSHFLDVKMNPAGRWSCTFNIAHPETFRWSSSSSGYGEGTNLQNIPK